MPMRVLSSAASCHDPMFHKFAVTHSSSDVSDIYLWLCAVSHQIDFYFYFPRPFFKGIVLLSIQPGLVRPYNWSGHFGEEKNFLSLPGVKL